MKKVLLFVLFTAQLALAESVVIHEWGTFTSLQDEHGNAIGGINTDDEPVPSFVHDVARGLLIPPSQVPNTFYQGAPACHPDVTMRLETPVLYVHAPRLFKGTIDVHVAFHGGWLTQYYPKAESKATGVRPVLAAWNEFGKITERTVSTLSWRKVQVEPEETKLTGPKTDDPVWLAPGRVKARMLTADGETERFLFYRGVGHLNAPLKVTRRDVHLWVDWQKPMAASITKLWLLDVRDDGKAAVQMIGSIEGDNIIPAQIPSAFHPKAYRDDMIEVLKRDMRMALINDGLFADEADALLNTWELSYFKSPGLRLFFLVPREWTDRVLPLEAKAKGDEVGVTARTMVGRIEIVTPAQRDLLRIISKGPVPNPWEEIRDKTEQATIRSNRLAAWNDLLSGKRSFKDLNIELPPVFQAYVQLGRFRDALVLDEIRRAPTPELIEFAKKFNIKAYTLR